jgi:predicted helicase
MSNVLIQNYFAELDRLKKFSGSLTEGIISEAFKDLLKAWSKQSGLIFLSQYEFISPQKNRIRPDGTIVHELRVPLGYWEAKDTGDDIDKEIAKKFAKGYPQDNIIFENSDTAVLIQNRNEVLRCSMTDPVALGKLVALFFSYERQEIAEFRKAVQQFRADLPAVLDALRGKIDAAYRGNKEFIEAADAFLAQAKRTINPSVSEADIQEMLIQHILTEEIFSHVFNESDFHRENNIAKSLYALEAKFFTGSVKRDTLRALDTYYSAIRANAAQITSHAEKQAFLKVIYENFYKVYNPKAADRLGVVYTPNEIVKFMIEGADWLCEKHFGKNLIDHDVQILDPATGTGTFICELLEHFRGQPSKLTYKYKEELHANEVAILPYYVANLNIEATYAAITGQYVEYPNLCFVDTLDNVEGLGIRAGHQHDLFGAMSEENVERIKRQNRGKISVVIGNPPYNANQQNENDNNKNRTYARIDQRIKDTYIKQSTAQKTKQYDMFVRFIRWASDRLHDNGVLAYIVNRKFIDGRNFDGFRKVVRQEFDECRVVDLGGDFKLTGAGGGGNVFGIGTGVAVIFLVRRHPKAKKKTTIAGQIFYTSVSGKLGDEKLDWMASNPLRDIKPESILPNEAGYWIDNPSKDFGNALPIASKAVKARKLGSIGKAVFDLFSLGVSTNRDEWLYDQSETNLKRKSKEIIKIYDADDGTFSSKLKWSRNLKRRFLQKKREEFNSENIYSAMYRPFIKKYFLNRICLLMKLASLKV